MSVADLRFEAMGSTLRVVADDRGDAHGAAAAARAFLDDVDRRLSRFRPGSELTALNADGRQAFPASPLLRAAVGAAAWAAATTGGLVDPTLLTDLEAAGYGATRATATPAPLRDALAAAPARRPARPRPDGRWRAMAVDDRAGAVVRPPGLRLDTGGTTKGLAADAAVHRFAGLDRVAVDCAGDVRVGGREIARRPFELDVEHPLTGEVAQRLLLAGGACATSAVDRNVWRRPDGSFAHHLLDPATGEPAWTGLIGATALAPTALEAETLAKWALLGGPESARRVLARHGGLAFHDDGAVEPLGLLARSEAAA